LEPSRREATTYYFGIKRAHEEIIHLNVEITCLLTFMLNNHVDYYHTIRKQILTNPSLARSLSMEWEYQDRIHKSIVLKLVQTSRLPGFSGSLSLGCHLGHDPALRTDVPLPQWTSFLQSRDCPDVMMHEPVIEEEGEMGNDDDDILREVNIDTELVVQLSVLKSSLVWFFTSKRGNWQPQPV
jgi:hypothetical protein